MTTASHPPITGYSTRNTAGPYPSAGVDLPLAWIRPSTYNPRRTFDQAALDELAASIRTHGLLEPLVVRPLAGQPDTYEIMAGERRYRAAQQAGLETVPVRILEGVDDRAALEIALIENLARQDLDPIEEAEGYRALAQVCGLKQTEIAAAVKRSQPAVAKSMGLLDLPEDVRELVRARALTVAHGVALLRYRAFPAVCSAIAAQAVERNVTSKDLESRIPDPYALQERKLLQILYTPFDACKKCPFDAKRSNGGMAVCLRPDHWEQLREEDRRAEAARARDAATAQGSGQVPRLRDLDSDTYEDVSERYGYAVPPTCTEACPCRGVAISYSGQTVPICTDPARYKGLRDEEDARRKAAVEQDARAYLQTLERVMDTTPVAPLQVALLLARFLQWGMNVAALRAAVKRHAPDLYTKKLSELKAEQLATLPVDTQIKLVFEAQARREVADWSTNHRYSQTMYGAFFAWLRATDGTDAPETEAAVAETLEVSA